MLTKMLFCIFDEKHFMGGVLGEKWEAQKAKTS